MAPVDLKGFYAYLLWSRALEGVSEEALKRPLVRKRLRSVKALLLHTAVVDAWLHEDILRAPMVLARFPEGEGLPREVPGGRGPGHLGLSPGPGGREPGGGPARRARGALFPGGTSSGTPSCTRRGTWLRWFFCCAFWGWSLPLWTSTFS
jgi:hypothetical protein